ncbi:hypothetical protein HSX11_11195 [Oxalobacteraceae bacterium]|nr:hypothetical protein [Oxalobacteraceae bacterium]
MRRKLIGAAFVIVAVAAGMIVVRRTNTDSALPQPAPAAATARVVAAALLYRVKAGGKPERSIVFRWNGKQFEDASGAYQNIADAYQP